MYCIDVWLSISMYFEYYEVYDEQNFINDINKLITGNEVVFE